MNDGVKSLGLMVALALSAVGCVSLQDTSSGKIGCAPYEITISDEHLGFGSRTWTATCHEKRYFCSNTSTGQYSSDVSCTAEAPH